ncbi:sensor histidine kinase, partial [Nocardioides hankookensis]
RHADPRRCTVTLSRTAEGIGLTVTDDGLGLSDQPSAGIGLRSMRERATELGGSLEIATSEAGGTTIRMSLPTSVG